MAEEKPSGAQQMFGDFAPAFVELTDGLLMGDVWERSGLSRRDRSLVTVAVLAATGRPEQLRFHLGFAIDNGLSVEELTEALTHLAFYAGWPSAVTALTQLKSLAEARAAF